MILTKLICVFISEIISFSQEVKKVGDSDVGHTETPDNKCKLRVFEVLSQGHAVVSIVLSLAYDRISLFRPR